MQGDHYDNYWQIYSAGYLDKIVFTYYGDQNFYQHTKKQHKTVMAHNFGIIGLILMDSEQ